SQRQQQQQGDDSVEELNVQIGPQHKQRWQPPERATAVTSARLENESDFNRKKSNREQHRSSVQAMMYRPHPQSGEQPCLPKTSEHALQERKDYGSYRDFECNSQTHQSHEPKPVIQARHDDFKSPTIVNPGALGMLGKNCALGKGVLRDNGIACAQMPPEIQVKNRGGEGLEAGERSQQNHQSQAARPGTIHQVVNFAPGHNARYEANTSTA